MGRRKIAIKPIVDDRNRSVTFHKRKNGLFKKAYELAVLCQADVALIVFGQKGKLYEFSSCEIHEILHRYAESEGEPREVKRLQDEKLGAHGDDDDDDDFDVYATPPLNQMGNVPVRTANTNNGTPSEAGSHISTPSMHTITPPVPRIDQSPRSQSQVYAQNIAYPTQYPQHPQHPQHPSAYPAPYYSQSQQQYYSHITDPRRHPSAYFAQPSTSSAQQHHQHTVYSQTLSEQTFPPNRESHPNRPREASFPQRHQPLYSRDSFPPRSQSVDLPTLSRPRLSVQIPPEPRKQRHKSEEASDERTVKVAYLPQPSPTTAVYRPPIQPDPTPISSIPPSRYAGPFSPSGDIYQGLFGKSDPSQYKRQRDHDEDVASEGKRSRVDGD